MPRAHRLSLVVALVGALFAAAGEPVTLESLVGPADYKAMGLDKLNADEQARLVRWLQRRVADQPLPMTTPTISFSVARSAPTAAPVAATAAAPSATAASSAATPVAAAVAAAAPAAASTPAPSTAPTTAATPRATIGTAESFGLRQDEVDGEVTEIRARIVGEFKGWDGQTVFKLDNGQVWRQAISGTYRFKATDPEVIIEKSFLGYKLRLVETHRSIPVRRIK